MRSSKTSPSKSAPTVNSTSNRLRAGDQVLVHITDLFEQKGGFDPRFWAVVVSKPAEKRGRFTIVFDRIESGVMPRGFGPGTELNLERHAGGVRLYTAAGETISAELLDQYHRTSKDAALAIDVMGEQTVSVRRVDGQTSPLPVVIRDTDATGHPRSRKVLVDHTGLSN